MRFDDAIHSLRGLGLNIFLSTKVSDLPDNIYPFSDEQKNKTLCLLGHGGRELWKHIPDRNIPNPIDSFCINQMQLFAENVLTNDIEILFPNDQIILPLQKIGRYFKLSQASPLGIDISNEFGLWFAYRGVFLTDKTIPLIKLGNSIFPCESCSDKPCLSVSDANEARMKCPFKREHQYTTQQRQYHQQITANWEK